MAPSKTPAKKAASKETPKVVTPEKPTVTEEGMHDPDTADVLKAHAQDVPRATAQDAPTSMPMGAVNDSNPTATTNRFSGVYPNNSYPLVGGKLDEVQEMRKQARDEGARTRRVSSAAARAPHPPLTKKYDTNDHAARRAAEDGVA